MKKPIKIFIGICLGITMLFIFFPWGRIYGVSGESWLTWGRIIVLAGAAFLAFLVVHYYNKPSGKLSEEELRQRKGWIDAECCIIAGSLAALTIVGTIDILTDSVSWFPYMEGAVFGLAVALAADLSRRL